MRGTPTAIQAPPSTMRIGRILGKLNPIKKEQIITCDEDVVSGTPVFAGTRVPIAILIDYLKTGDSLERFLEGFPTVKRAQAIAFLDMALEAALIEKPSARAA